MRNSVHILGRTEPKYCNYEGREEWIRKEKYYYYILIKKWQKYSSRIINANIIQKDKVDKVFWF